MEQTTFGIVSYKDSDPHAGGGVALSDDLVSCQLPYIERPDFGSGETRALAPNESRSPNTMLANFHALGVVPFNLNLNKLSHRFKCLVCKSAEFTSVNDAKRHNEKLHHKDNGYRWLCVCDGLGFEDLRFEQTAPIQALSKQLTVKTEPTDDPFNKPPTPEPRNFQLFNTFAALQKHQSLKHPSRKLARPISCCNRRFKLNWQYRDHVEREHGRCKIRALRDHSDRYIEFGN